MLEALVAIAILSLSLAALSYGGAVALRGQFRAEQVMLAVHQAERKLATLGRSLPLTAGEQVTRLRNGWVERVMIAPMAAPGGNGPRRTRSFQPYDVRVIVEDENGRPLASLATVRLATLQ